MDDRQAQIRERAGLEESRLNVEFIEWLRKWGSPLLLIAALAGAAWVVRERLQRGQSEKVDRAFTEFEAAAGTDNPSPDALLAVATEFSGVRAVPTLAKLEAADAYLDGVRRGVRLGAVLKRDDAGRFTGELENAEDALSDADRAAYLDKAFGLYTDVYNQSAADPAKLLTSVNALYGLAAVAEARGSFDQARQNYEKISSLTTNTAFAAHAAICSRRITRLDVLAKAAPAIPKAQIPKPPEPPAPPAPAAIPADAAAPGVTVTPVTSPAPAPEGTPATPTAPPAQPAPAQPQPTPAQPQPAPAEPQPGTPK